MSAPWKDVCVVGRNMRVLHSWGSMKASQIKKDGGAVKQRHFHLTSESKRAQVQDLLPFSEVLLNHSYDNCHLTLGFNIFLT